MQFGARVTFFPPSLMIVLNIILAGSKPMLTLEAKKGSINWKLSFCCSNFLFFLGGGREEKGGGDGRVSNPQVMP